MSGLGCRRGAPRDVPALILSAVGQERPDDARVLVRERHRSDVGVSPRGQPRKPALGLIGMPFEMPQDGSCPMDQQRTQVHIAALADAEQLRLASGGVLARNQTDPRRELATILECSGIANACYQGARG